MKKITSISLFIFFCVTTAILTAGLVFYQNNKKSNQNTDNKKYNENINLVKNKNNTTTNSNSIILNLQEISKHNKTSDCWILVEGKVYDITSYFGKHPGGSNTMSPTCGKDATYAYKTQDPYASSSGSRSAHSSRAKNLLNNYYIGDLNQKSVLNTSIN